MVSFPSILEPIHEGEEEEEDEEEYMPLQKRKEDKFHYDTAISSRRTFGNNYSRG